jgi:epoxyqueuosine reductase
LGFDACGVSSAKRLIEDSAWFEEWIAKGLQGEMDYMARNKDKRIDPSILVPGAMSVISVLLNYYPGNPEVSITPPKISRYALSTDYHIVVKGMLHKLLDIIRKEFGAVSGRAFVDTAPVLERAWTVRAGLGWIGKNGMLINQTLGSYVFIGELIVDLEIEAKSSEATNRCGTCTRCIDACPTGAIVKPFVVDARKCISYLTIEKKTPLTETEKKSLSGWCFGCDICQEVCPWNTKLEKTSTDQISPKIDILKLTKSKIQCLSNEEYENIFGKTSVNRSGYKSFIENSMLL